MKIYNEKITVTDLVIMLIRRSYVVMIPSKIW